MQLSNERTLKFFGGVSHEDGDLERTWKGSIFLAYDLAAKIEDVIKVTNVGRDSVEYCVLDAQREPYLSNPAKLFVLKEYPDTTIFSENGSIYQITKIVNRQWRRGVNNGTVRIECLRTSDRPRLRSFERAAFEFKPISFEAAVNQAKENLPQVLSHHLWMEPNNSGIFNLFYDELFIGMVDRDKNLFAHSETFTLAEEAINDLGLRVPE
jgi:hypothetical protein